MSEKQPRLKLEEDKEHTVIRSPPKKSKVEQSQPKKKKLKLDADKAAEKAQHLRFGKADIPPDEASRMTKQQKRAMYTAAAARSAVHREVDQYEEDNVGTQALNEGMKAEDAISEFSSPHHSRKLKKKAKLHRKKAPAAKSSAFGLNKSETAENSGRAVRSEGGSAIMLQLILVTQRPRLRADRKRHPVLFPPRSPAWSRPSTGANR